VEGTGVAITFDCDIHVRETFETSRERIWLFPPPRTLIYVFMMSCIPHFGQNLKLFSKWQPYCMQTNRQLRFPSSLCKFNEAVRTQHWLNAWNTCPCHVNIFLCNMIIGGNSCEITKFLLKINFGWK
jgi:hypothetical protein